MPLQVTNQEDGRTAAILTLQAAYVTNPAISVTPDATDQNKPMVITFPTVLTNTRVFQSSENPCAVNTITVDLVINVPLFVHCAPAITFSGLTSSSSATATNIVLLSDGIAISSWSRETGESPLRVAYLHTFHSCVWPVSSKLTHSHLCRSPGPDAQRICGFG